MLRACDQKHAPWATLTNAQVAAMLHELWHDPETEGGFTFCIVGPHGAHARGLLSSSARLVWTVKAASHFEAMTRYFEHQGWGTYTSDNEWDKKTYAELGWEIDGQPVMEPSQVALLTRNLRRSDDRLFARLRELLPEFGIDVGTALLAEFFPDDVDQEFGVLVSADRAVFTFVLHYARRGDLNTQVRTATISHWRDLSDRWESSPYRRYVQEALRLPDGWDA